MKKMTLLLLISCYLSFSQDFSVEYSLSNTLATTLTNYQVLIEVDTQTLISNGYMQSDCDDIRFIPSIGSTDQFDYWIESGCNTSNTRIWVEVSSIPSGGTLIFMTYGDVGASGVSNGEQTFLFFDDFSSGIIDVAKWNGNALAVLDPGTGDPDIPSAKLNLSTVNDVGLSSTLIPTNHVAIHSSFYDTGFNSGVKNTWNGLYGPNIFLGVINSTSVNYFTFLGSAMDTGIPRTVGWHQSEIYFSNNMAKVILDQGAYESALTATPNVTTTGITFYSWNEQANFDTIFVRKWEVEVNVTEGETLAIEDMNDRPKTLVYPNPATDHFKINGLRNAQIVLYNALGEQLMEKDDYNGESIPVSHLNSGLYFIKISDGHSDTVEKIIMQ